ncbi:hypothetical protein AAKU64_004495 [Undibacterium sp. GrIS 1.8]
MQTNVVQLENQLLGREQFHPVGTNLKFKKISKENLV